jgi:hypothetical protein
VSADEGNNDGADEDDGGEEAWRVFNTVALRNAEKEKRK